MEDNKEAIKILEYVLGRSKERRGTRMYNKGITLYPDINKERAAIERGIEALKAMDGMMEVQVVTTKMFTDKPIEAEPEKVKEVKFGGF